MTASPQNKEELRQIYLKKRMLISSERRREAREALLSLKPFLSSFDYVLSFSSFRFEIDTSLLNKTLCEEGRLLLAKMHGSLLTLYHVTDLSRELLMHPFGLLEPNSALCKKIDPERVKIALVPALAFDRLHHRLGYGGGFYDRFLTQNPHMLTWGIGYREQLVDMLPATEQDRPQSELKLF